MGVAVVGLRDVSLELEMELDELLVEHVQVVPLLAFSIIIRIHN